MKVTIAERCWHDHPTVGDMTRPNWNARPKFNLVTSDLPVARRWHAMHRPSSLLLLLVSLLCPIQASAETFAAPVEDPEQIACSYDTLQCFSSGEHHTGIDYDYSAGQIAKSAASGRVVMIVPFGAASHGLGNTVIIAHHLADGGVVYSLYAHLASVDPGLALEPPRDVVLQGQPLGAVGGSGKTSLSDWGAHLHFEMKEAATLGNPIGNEPYWGYTPTTADDFGYYDPSEYLGNSEIYVLSQIVVNEVEMRAAAEPNAGVQFLEIRGANLSVNSNPPTVVLSSYRDGAIETLTDVRVVTFSPSVVIVEVSGRDAGDLLLPVSSLGVMIDNGETRSEFNYPFRDVSPGTWFDPYVVRLWSRGVVRGRQGGEFEPSSTVTRAEFLKMITGALEWRGDLLQLGEVPLSEDVKIDPRVYDAWYYEDLRKAYASENENYSVGDRGDRLAFWSVEEIIGSADMGDVEAVISAWVSFWAQGIRRTEAARVAMNALKLGQASTWQKVLLFSSDVPLSILDSDWIYACRWHRIVSGRNGRLFDPSGLLNRAEAAKIVWNILPEDG